MSDALSAIFNYMTIQKSGWLYEVQAEYYARKQWRGVMIIVISAAVGYFGAHIVGYFL